MKFPLILADFGLPFEYAGPQIYPNQTDHVHQEMTRNFIPQTDLPILVWSRSNFSFGTFDSFWDFWNYYQTISDFKELIVHTDHKNTWLATGRVWSLYHIRCDLGAWLNTSCEI